MACAINIVVSCYIPPLHGTKVKFYGQRICQVTEKVMNDLAIGKSFYAYPTMQKITLEIILQSLFGLDISENCQSFSMTSFQA